jgi:putative endonuclease
MTKQPAVYILASKQNGTLYIGVTSDLQKRVWEHKNDFVEGFTKRYGVHRLVYYELHTDMISAITTVKEMEPGMEARTNRKTESRVDGFVERNWLRIKRLDSRFRGNDGLLSSGTMVSLR